MRVFAVSAMKVMLVSLTVCVLSLTLVFIFGRKVDFLQFLMWPAFGVGWASGIFLLMCGFKGLVLLRAARRKLKPFQYVFLASFVLCFGAGAYATRLIETILSAF